MKLHLQSKSISFNREYGMWVNESKQMKGTNMRKSTIIFRLGNNQNFNNSFLLSVYNSKSNKITSANEIFNLIINNLTPKIFIELNCGDIFKYFHQQILKTIILKM